MTVNFNYYELNFWPNVFDVFKYSLNETTRGDIERDFWMSGAFSVGAYVVGHLDGGIGRVGPGDVDDGRHELHYIRMLDVWCHLEGCVVWAAGNVHLFVID